MAEERSWDRPSNDIMCKLQLLSLERALLNTQTFIAKGFHFLFDLFALFLWIVPTPFPLQSIFTNQKLEALVNSSDFSPVKINIIIVDQAT